MTTPRADPEHPLPALGRGGEPCHRCTEPLLADQRYCLACGARRGAGGPIDFGALLRPVALGPASPTRTGGWRGHVGVPLPVAATMLLALLVTGILLGGLGGARDTQAAERLAIELPAAPPVATAPPAQLAQAPETIAPLPAAAEPATEEPAAPAVEAGTPEASTQEETGPADEAQDAPDPETEEPADETTVAAALTPIKHVFMIVLADQTRPSAFTPGAGAPYLSETLVPEGTLVRDLFAIGDSGPANAMALISGQPPTAQTLAGCPAYADVLPAPAPGAPDALDGCVHPAPTATLVTELGRASLGWRAYVESQEDGGSGVSATCRHPELGAADPWRDARPGDAYATARNPFVYFHSIIDSPDCAKNVVGLDALDADLARPPDDVPAFAYVVPDLCRDGRAVACAPDAPAGLASADAFLAEVVAKLRASKVYAESLVVITFDRPAPAVAPAAAPGKLGALLLSPFVRQGRMIGGRRDVYSLLATVARVLGVDPLANAAAPAARPFGRGLFELPASAG